MKLLIFVASFFYLTGCGVFFPGGEAPSDQTSVEETEEETYTKDEAEKVFEQEEQEEVIVEEMKVEEVVEQPKEKEALNSGDEPVVVEVSLIDLPYEIPVDDGDDQAQPASFLDDLDKKDLKLIINNPVTLVKVDVGTYSGDEVLCLDLDVDVNGNSKKYKQLTASLFVPETIYPLNVNELIEEIKTYASDCLTSR